MPSELWERDTEPCTRPAARSAAAPARLWLTTPATLRSHSTIITEEEVEPAAKPSTDENDMDLTKYMSGRSVFGEGDALERHRSGGSRRGLGRRPKSMRERGSARSPLSPQNSSPALLRQGSAGRSTLASNLYSRASSQRSVTSPTASDKAGPAKFFTPLDNDTAGGGTSTPSDAPKGAGAGAGVGAGSSEPVFSSPAVQRKHVQQLPKFSPTTSSRRGFQIDGDDPSDAASLGMARELRGSQGSDGVGGLLDALAVEVPGSAE